MYITVYTKQGHYTRVKIEAIFAVNICSDWHDPKHNPRIDLATINGGVVELENNFANIYALKKAGIVEENYIPVPKPEGWKEPEDEHPMAAMLRMAEDRRRQMQEIDKEIEAELEDEDKVKQ